MNLQRILLVKNYLRPLQPCCSFFITANPYTQNKMYKNEILPQLIRSVSTIGQKSLVKEENIIKKVLGKIPFVNINKSRLDLIGYILYESVADGIDYVNIFKELALADSFYSWFVVTELHLWLLMVRCMAEGKDGREVRNRIVHALWADVRQRIKKVGTANPSGIRYQISELSEQFQAALLAYDEGLQTDDTVLAAALWRRMYQQREVDPEHLDHFVKFIRKQVKILDNLSKEDLFSMKPIKWEPVVVK